jgi:hypothetical protein
MKQSKTELFLQSLIASFLSLVVGMPLLSGSFPSASFNADRLFVLCSLEFEYYIEFSLVCELDEFDPVRCDLVCVDVCSVEQGDRFG